ncbi:hypothetical protein FGO68_gene11033 [Halteria grandinella]|uniref:Uncharacterized protein n=1 Tax=Halteria grandinella TaxID=5974 RepID=A0A8J8NW78_HALGN|nr:hypothetical protein FGO68_gene11033 [Halteria grandinella]
MSLKKIYKFTKRFFERQSKLSAIINKSRLFNTFECLYEMACIVFYNAIASRLNQQTLVITNTLSAFLSIFGQIFIHVSPRQLYYRNSIFINGVCELFLAYQMYQQWLCFKAVINDCSTIWTYYEVKNGDRATAPSHNICVNAHILHALWLFFNGALLAARNYSIIQMVKGLMYLLRREKERERRMQRQIFKAKRFRERKRNELERKIEKKKKELREQQLAERREIDEDYIVMEKRKLEDMDRQRQQLLMFN